MSFDAYLSLCSSTPLILCSSCQSASRPQYLDITHFIRADVHSDAVSFDLQVVDRLADEVDLPRADGGADERSFFVLKELHEAQPPGQPRTLTQLKAALREQSLLIRIDEERTIAAIPKLLPRDPQERARALRAVQRLISAQGDLSDEGRRRLARVEKLFAAKSPTARNKENLDVRS